MILEALESGALPVQFSSTLTTNWTNITSITNIDKYWKFTGKDYKYARYQIAIIAATTGFSNLSTEEKQITSRWFATEKANRDTVYTTSEQEVFGQGFHTNSVISRTTRFKFAVSKIYNRLSLTQANTIVSDIGVNMLDFKYINYGREGTVEGDPEGLLDYIEARTGTSYETTGLAVKGYTPDGITLAQLIIDVADILKNGNY